MASAQTVVPVADLNCSTSSKYSEAEIAVRNKVASLYRLIDLTVGLMEYTDTPV